ncbi:MAG: three-Cys-motif partner protein TcmP [Oscillospiraceae bacterium]|nr:three-Cys-motif partner protein TcmP [Oscillospiraceae bacterium]
MARAKQVEIITEAKPHTVKKFELIDKYVDEWARKILGFKGKYGYAGSKGVIYIDCMSNSGVYKDIEGNLVDGTALRVAKHLNEIITNYPGKNAILVFNDLYPERVEFLKQEIEKAKLEYITVSYQHGDCNDFLRGLDLSSFKQQYNTLLLYDPYKASIDWDAVTPYLNRWGEVIINHMVSDTARGASLAKKPQVIDRYQETYQNDIASILEYGNDKEQLNNIIVSIIKSNTKNFRAKHYIASFPFFNRTNGLVYNLIHCCSNIEGLKLFKKVAWKTFGDKSSLKNTHENQAQLMFDFNGTGIATTQTDEQCYYVIDIAKYLYDKYHAMASVTLDMIYHDLDEHPIFPSDGYKNDIKNELKQTYGVTFTKDGEVIFSTK